MSNIMFRNSMTGETRSYEGWKLWAERFYASLAESDFGPMPEPVLMPHDWWQRTCKVLRLIPVDAE